MQIWNVSKVKENHGIVFTEIILRLRYFDTSRGLVQMQQRSTTTREPLNQKIARQIWLISMLSKYTKHSWHIDIWDLYLISSLFSAETYFRFYHVFLLFYFIMFCLRTALWRVKVTISKMESKENESRRKKLILFLFQEIHPTDISLIA